MTKGSFEEVVNFAKEKEQEAADFYVKLAENAAAEGIKQAMLEMAEQEKKHKQALEEMSLDAFKDSEPPQEIEDLKLATTMPEMAAKPDMNYQQLLTVAIKREESAEKLYRHMAAAAREDIQKQLLERLAAEELKHRNILEKEYDDKVLAEN